MSSALLLTWLGRSRPSPRRLLGAVALSILSGGASILLLGGSGLLVGRAAGGGGLAALGGLLVLIELVAFLRAPLRFEERLVTHRVALGSMVRWRTWLYDTVAARLPGSLSTLASGELLDRAIEDVDALEDLYVRIALPVLTAVVTGLLAAVVVAVVLPAAGLLLVIVSALGLGAAVIIGQRAGAGQTDAARWRGELSARSVDLLDGMTELVTAGQIDQQIAQIEAAESRRIEAASRRATLRGVGTATIALVAGGGLLGTALLAASRAHSGSITSSEAAAITLVAVAGLEPLLGALGAALRAPEVAESAVRLDELAAAPLPVVEPDPASQWPQFAAQIELRGVEAPATAGGEAVLRGASLSIAPGERIAVLGASGAGKSTLCRLLMRFLDVTDGRLEVGGVRISSIRSDEVRRHVALLDQSPTLFGGTIADTLRLGDAEASDEELIDVLERCQLGELIAAEGLSTRVAEGGETLSGGQQRRLALARAVLRRPELLVLDEPTVGLAPAQGREVLSSCLAAAGHAAVLLVTHDINEAEGFDQLLWLEEGTLRPLAAAEIESLRR